MFPTEILWALSRFCVTKVTSCLTLFYTSCLCHLLYFLCSSLLSHLLISPSVSKSVLPSCLNGSSAFFTSDPQLSLAPCVLPSFAACVRRIILVCTFIFSPLVSCFFGLPLFFRPQLVIRACLTSVLCFCIWVLALLQTLRFLIVLWCPLCVFSRFVFSIDFLR